MNIYFWILDLLIPAGMLMMAFVYTRYAPYDSRVPKTGYRTKRSMKSKESWDYAHKICAKLYTRIGLTWTVLVVLAKLILPYEPGDMSIVFGIISVILFLLPLPIVELCLWRKQRGGTLS